MGRGADLPPKVKKAFRDLSDEQRGGAERTMEAIQYATQGSVLNPVVERAGDILNRMNKDIDWVDDFHFYDVTTKLETVLHGLRHPYGFRREIREQIDTNRLTTAQRAKLSRLLRRYAEEFAKLPVYNRAQYVAREGAIQIGCQNFERAEQYYTVLESMMLNRDTWIEAASRYRLGPGGRPVALKRAGRLC